MKPMPRCKFLEGNKTYTQLEIKDIGFRESYKYPLGQLVWVIFKTGTEYEYSYYAHAINIEKAGCGEIRELFAAAFHQDFYYYADQTDQEMLDNLPVLVGESVRAEVTELTTFRGNPYIRVQWLPTKPDEV